MDDECGPSRNFAGSNGGPLPKRKPAPCECPEPGCQHDEERFALWRIAKAIVDAYDYGGSATTICRAVADNINEMRDIARGK